MCTDPAVSDPAHPTILVAEALGPLTQMRIAFRANRLARVFWLSAEDIEDLMQDGVLEVLLASRKYDPEKGTIGTFLRGVLDKWYMHTARTLRTRRERRPRIMQYPVNEETGETIEFVDRSPSHIALVDARMDFDDILSRCPRAERLLAEELKDKSVAEIALDAGVHRGTVHRRIEPLRAALRKPLEKSGYLVRDKLPPHAEK